MAKLSDIYHKPTDTQQHLHLKSHPHQKKKKKMLHKIHPLHSST